MEDHILSAAMKLSYGEDLQKTLSCLHDDIKASEDTLTHDLEACNWFNLSIPTMLLNCQPFQSLPAAEIDYSSVLQKAFDNLVGDKTLGGLASPPYSPNSFPSAPTMPGSPCINPQLLKLQRITLNEDMDMQGENEDEDAIGVKQAQEDEVEEDQEEEGQEESEEEGQEEQEEPEDDQRLRGMSF
jgi:hypothetical protein